ncbi:Alpha/Beta hydrolase protein [Scenedesmus sp. NREL 46B-D3]|nr:Alpha/Beta hydrolase protein [Scenedesmus sp. NREL 46B-D3]
MHLAVCVVLQELLCTLMFGILQSRQVSAWRGFFSAVGDLAAWVPVEKQHVTTGSCSSVWVRLPAAKRPQHPRAHINLVFFHGGAFVAGDALMYLGTYAYWLHKLAAAGISCSILSVDYPLAPEHPFPAAIEAAADVIEWLAKESGEAAPFIVGESLSVSQHHGWLKSLQCSAFNLALYVCECAWLNDVRCYGWRQQLATLQATIH